LTLENFMRWFRRIAIGAVAVAVLVTIGVIALLVLVDPDSYRKPVADTIKQRYGRTLRIDGDLKLALFPRLGVHVEKLSLSEPHSTQTFAVIDSARVSVALWPLLSRRIVLDHVRVSGLKANIVRNRNGKFNFDDLIATAQNTDLQTAPVPMREATAGAIAAEGTSVQLDVTGMDFTGGELAYRDFASGTSLRFERVAATTGRMAPGVPFAFDASARVLGQSPRLDAAVESQGTMLFDPSGRNLAVRNLDFRATGVLPSVRATAFTARGDLAYDVRRSAIDATNVAILFQGDVAGTTPLTGIETRIDAARAAIELGAGRLEVDKLSVTAQGKADNDPFEASLSAPRLSITDRQASGEGITGRARLTGQPGMDARFSLAGLSGNGDKLQLDQFHVNAEFRQGPRVVRVTGDSPIEASLKQRTLTLPAVTAQVQIEDPALPAKTLQIPLTGHLRGDLNRQALAARLDGRIGGDAFSVVADAAQWDAPRVSFSMIADTFDLDALWPGARNSAGTPGAPPRRPVADEPVDLSGLQGLTVNGSVKFKSLVARGVKANEVGANLRIAGGRAELSNVRAALYGGRLNASLFADGNAQRLGGSGSLTSVQLQPLLSDLTGTDTLTGRATLTLSLASGGKTVDALKRNVEGTVQAQVRDGAIQGVNLAQSLREFRSLAGGASLVGAGDMTAQQDAARRTDFTDMTAYVTFVNGMGTVRGLTLKSPLLRVTEGDPARIDVPAGALDLMLRVNVVATPAGQDGKDLASLRGLAVPVHVSGPIERPTTRIRWSQVGGTVLRGVVGVRAGTPLEGVSAPAGQGGRGEGAATDADSPSREPLRERLKGLFNR
jgi:AsmA protein